MHETCEKCVIYQYLCTDHILSPVTWCCVPDQCVPEHCVWVSYPMLSWRLCPDPHRNENSIYIFHFWELCGLSPNFHVLVYGNELYIPRIDPHICCRRICRSIVGIHKSVTDTWMGKLGLWPRNFFYGNICFQFSVLVLCNAGGTKLQLLSYSKFWVTFESIFSTFKNVWLMCSTLIFFLLFCRHAPNTGRYTGSLNFDLAACVGGV